jgi:type II secretory ATPase GspE/PulE/Tfp pilus assembly ATPase PilB-like protein
MREPVDVKDLPASETGKTAAPARLRFGDRLVARGIITTTELRVALEEQKRTGEPIGKVLECLGFVTDEDLVRLVAEDLGVDFVRLADQRIDVGLRRAFDSETLRQGSMLPLHEEKGIVTVATARPSDVASIDLLQRVLKKPLRIVAAARADIDGALSQTEDEGRPIELATIADATAQVEAVIARAIRERATDIHVEPDERLVRIRFRVDGVLRAADSLPASAAPAFLSRLKVLAELDLAEHRRPQDGRFQRRVHGRAFDFRVAVMPTRHGENIVLRLLERGGGTARLDDLGLPDAARQRLAHVASLPHGLLLVTGPTGSGKTTTLYALLRSIDALTRKVTSIEDPIEAEVPLVRQSQIDPSIGYGFAEGLRAMLRQDPDVILVGEIRDKETAEIALRASLTGHLVMATLHANDAIAAAPRLLDMDIEPYLLSTSLSASLAQRLVRRLCAHCASDGAPDADDVLLFGSCGEKLPSSVRKSVGCPRCAGTGFHGRLGIYELFEPDAAAKRLLLERGSDQALRATAAALGYREMACDGASKVAAGRTTSSEVLRVTRA